MMGIKCSDVVKMQLDCFYEENKDKYIVQDLEKRRFYKVINCIDAVLKSPDEVEVWVDEQNCINISFDAKPFSFVGDDNILSIIDAADNIVIKRSDKKEMINLCLIFDGIWVER